MSKKKKIAIAGGAAVGLAGIAAGAALAAAAVFGSEQTTHERFAAPIHGIVVEGDAGDIEVSTGGPGVEVARKTSWLFSKPAAAAYVRDGVLHIETNNEHWLLSKTDVRVRIPAGLRVDLKTDAGNVEVYGAPGDVKAYTDAGDVRVDLAHAPRNLDVQSDAGDVRVTVPRGAYAVSTSTDAGDETVHGVISDDRAWRTISATTDAGDVTVASR